MADTIDLTRGRQAACDEQEQTKELYRLVLTNISDTVFMTDEKGRFKFICPNVAIIFGYGPDEVAQKETVANLFGRDLCDYEYLQNEGEINNVECKIRDKSGFRHLLIVNIKKVSIAGVSVLYSCRDITNFGKLEDKNSRLAAIVQSTADAIISTDMEGNIQSWNNSACDMYGYHENEMIGKNVSVLRADDHKKELEDILEVINKGGSFNDYEAIHITRDGKRINVSVTSSPVTDRNGKPAGACAIIRDITERKRAEQKRRQDEINMALFADRMENLSGREFEVLEKVINGKLSKQIAAELGITVKTVEKHRSNIMTKLKTDSVAKLVRYHTLMQKT